MKINNAFNSDTALSLSKKTFLNSMHTQHILAESLSCILKLYDLSSEQFKVLTIISDQNGKTVNMQEIQESMIAKASNTTRLVDKLLQKELVTREICRQNRRKIEVSITTKGLKLLNKLNPAVTSNEEKFAHNLTLDELEKLNFLLEKYRTA